MRCSAPHGRLQRATLLPAVRPLRTLTCLRCVPTEQGQEVLRRFRNVSAAVRAPLCQRSRGVGRRSSSYGAVVGPSTDIGQPALSLFTGSRSVCGAGFLVHQCFDYSLESDPSALSSCQNSSTLRYCGSCAGLPTRSSLWAHCTLTTAAAAREREETATLAQRSNDSMRASARTYRVPCCAWAVFDAAAGQALTSHFNKQLAAAATG